MKASHSRSDSPRWERFLCRNSELKFFHDKENVPIADYLNGNGWLSANSSHVLVEEAMT